MAYTSVTAANYKDLLAVLVTMAAANGWVVLEQSETRVYLKGTGLAGLDEIYCGIETYEDPVNGRYNWNLVGSWGYRAGRALHAHPVSSLNNNTAGYQTVGHFWNSAIPYWLVCTPRRLVLVAKVGTTYQSIHLGLLTTPATEGQYPYPLLIGGGGNSLLINYSGATDSFWNNGYYSGRLSMPGGAWGGINSSTETPVKPTPLVSTFNEANKLVMLTGLDGSYLLEPFYLYVNNPAILGHIEGLFRVSGYNNTAENIITVAGVNYLVFPNGSRAGYGDYCAMRMN